MGNKQELRLDLDHDFGLTQAEWEKIQRHLILRKLGKGEALFLAGDTQEHHMAQGVFDLYVIKEGAIGLEIPSADPQADHSLMIQFGPGSRFNRIIGWPDERTVGSAYSLMNGTSVWVISSPVLATMLQNPRFAKKLIDYQSWRCLPYLRRIQVLVEEAAMRVKIFLNELEQDILRRGIEKPEIKFRLRHVNIALGTGLSRETVTRIINGDDPEIKALVGRLSAWVKFVARGGKLSQGESRKRASHKEEKLRGLAKNITEGLYSRLGIEPKGQKFRRSYEFVLKELLGGLTPGTALTRPEKELFLGSGQKSLPGDSAE